MLLHLQHSRKMAHSFDYSSLQQMLHATNVYWASRLYQALCQAARRRTAMNRTNMKFMFYGRETRKKKKWVNLGRSSKCQVEIVFRRKIGAERVSDRRGGELFQKESSEKVAFKLRPLEREEQRCRHQERGARLREPQQQRSVMLVTAADGSGGGQEWTKGGDQANRAVIPCKKHVLF